MYGLISTLGLAYINSARGGQSSILTYMFWFIVMCLLNVTFQLSGFYSILFTKEESVDKKSNDEENLHTNKITQLFNIKTNFKNSYN